MIQEQLNNMRRYKKMLEKRIEAHDDGTEKVTPDLYLSCMDLLTTINRSVKKLEGK